MPASIERELAAMFSADIVGYSRPMAEDETVRRLVAYRTEIANLVGEHRGQLVDFTGDNFLAEFPTATDAVEAAARHQAEAPSSKIETLLKDRLTHRRAKA